MWKVLVVDDNFANRQLLVEMLRDLAYCDVAVNGQEAIEAYNRSVAQGKPYDCILLDIAMPEIDGLVFLTMVRDSEHQGGIAVGEGVPIIMITAYPLPLMDAFNRGCDDYVLKPVHADQLLARMKDKIEKKVAS